MKVNCDSCRRALHRGLTDPIFIQNRLKKTSKPATKCSAKEIFQTVVYQTQYWKHCVACPTIRLGILNECVTAKRAVDTPGASDREFSVFLAPKMKFTNSL